MVNNMNKLKKPLKQFGAITIVGNIKAYGVVVLLFLMTLYFPVQLKAENKGLLSNKSNNTNPVIEIQVPMGKLRIELYREQAPKTVAKLIDLVKSSYFNQSTVFESRANLGFVIAKIGKSAEAFYFKDELNALPSRRGSFAISKSNVSKAYLNNLFVGFDKQPELQKHYIIIGQVLEGLELIEKNPSGQIRPVSSFTMVEDSQITAVLN